jgi:putative redox protein
MIVSYVLDGAKIHTDIGEKFSIDSDQPAPFGEDTAPSPYDVFLASVAACTAYFAQRYCRKWNLSHAGIAVELEPVFSAQHTLTDIRLKIRTPEGFPAEHADGLLRNASACPVKKALENPPVITAQIEVRRL